ncbi:MAG: hypothetical protein ACYSVY_07170 [Planctomycetota bacterium]
MNAPKSRLRTHGFQRSGEAFTLVELLVVASIIALLISILLPSLKKAREQAKMAVCIANLKGIATASLVYAAEDETEQSTPIHHTVVDTTLDPRSRVRAAASSIGGKSGRGKEEGDYSWAPFWGTARQNGPATRPLNKFIYKDGFVDYALNPGAGFSNWRKDERLDLAMFRCPSDNGYQGIHYTTWKNSGLTSYNHYGNSYAANPLWLWNMPFGKCPDESVQSPCCVSIGAFGHPWSRIPNPSNTIYYEENVGRFAFQAHPWGIDGNCGRSPYPHSVVHGWHGRDWIFNVAFADAHAGQVKMKGFESPKLPEYPFPRYPRCRVARGPGWQKDTLPSPPVVSNIPCSGAPPEGG